jgi:LmbE family N-acetylglucosaminyl deacetylase
VSDAPEFGPRPGDRVLVVTAHPDDVDFGAGGTVRTWTSQGVEVTYLLCTDGHQGGIDESVSRTEMRVIRQAEQRAAGRELGVTDVRFLGHDDGSLFPTLELRQEIVRHIRDVQPRVLLAQSPERNWQRLFASHPDHMAAGEAAVQAVYPDARNVFAFPHLLDEGLQPWTVEELWVMAHPSPNTFIDTTDHFPAKVAALSQHKSQVDHMEDLEGRIREWGQMTGKMAGFEDGRLAEAFYVTSTA